MNIPPQILEQVCLIVNEKSGRTIPFSSRGITINRDLIETAMVVLNSSQGKTLPQNCRNDIRSRTPDGLDRRIKECLNMDTRTANIISDVLAEAGVVEIITVINPETGRWIKGTKLLDDWSWGGSAEKNNAAKNIPIYNSIQGKIQRNESVKQLGLDNIRRADYLNDPDVKNFIAWIESRLDMPGGFKHQYYLFKAKREWRCNCLYQAYENYWWPYNMTCPIKGKQVSGTGINDSFEYMNLLAETFRSAVHREDAAMTCKSALAMLTWGGVLNHNRERIVGMGAGICDYFKRIEEGLNLSNARLGNHEGIFINSGFTKLYFLLVDDFIMYDGRVGAALGLLGRLYAQETGLAKIPEMIEFSFGCGKVSAGRQADGNRRDPSTEKYTLPGFIGNHTRHLNDNIKASWLLKELADKTVSSFALLPQEPPLNKRLTAIQSALFMIGYDVQCYLN
jgi:hypothetical protein